MYTIKPIQNANDVKIELNNYFLNSNLQNLEKLLACSLGYELSLTDLQSINFQIKNLSTGKACYQAGIISLDLKYLQTIKNIEQLPKVFIILFHELSHAIAQRCNQIILTTKKNAELYLGEFYVDDIYNILLQQTNSKQQSAGAAYYLYYNCPNEVFARRNSFLMCEQFYKTFLPDCLNMLPTFQQKTSQDLATIYNLHPFLKNNEQVYYSLIENYQLNQIKNGLSCLNNKQITQFISSLVVTFSKKVRSALLEECLLNSQENLMQTFLSTPYFCPRPDELAKLQKTFPKNVVEQYMFKKTKGSTNVSKIISLN